ncbi:GAF domain-containing protein [Leptothoe sp. PORK10 BA2]|uniref:GAF domain-containing protein n=1 Tax=Leptothoe sp. PORK10 BA2 TaxID=3110254 RepID=UPI002B213D10|nr:GAF domain-containing protein [Leptothoe sp. PORK10 BA2]MEA5463734.1 GAF domain-containing protein [Leptothoe sp. PORK10 BA2]
MNPNLLARLRSICHDEAELEQIQALLSEEFQALELQVHHAHCQIDQQQTLFRLITRLREPLDLESIFKLTAAEVRQLLSADRVGMFRFHPDTGWNDGEFVSEDVDPEFDSAIAKKIHDHCFGDQFASHYQEGQIQNVTDIHDAGLSDCHIQILAQFQVRANLVVPLLQGRHLWGLLCIHQCRAPRQWQETEIEFVRQIASHLAVALQHAELWADLQAEVVERQQAEQRAQELNRGLQQAIIELKAVNQELEAFSYSVSHDLRAPLRSIDGFSQALLEDCLENLDENGQNYLHRIRSATQRMGALIDDLITLSRVTRNDMHKGAVNLSQLAHRICRDLQQASPERQVAWEIHPEMVAYGDRPLLQVMLDNLLNNAWKYTSKQPHPEIEFGVIIQENGMTAYFVRDNGVGFDISFVDKLFHPFQRLHGMHEFSGNGIGLATVQRIIHRHGGQVWAEGILEQGATFYFTLPEEDV